jgi:hypothetical protein
MKKVNLISKAEMKKVMGGTEDTLQSSVLPADCCLIGAGGLHVTVTNSSWDADYCKRLCDNAPLCTGLC